MAMPTRALAFSVVPPRRLGQSDTCLPDMAKECNAHIYLYSVPMGATCLPPQTVLAMMGRLLGELLYPLIL